MDADAATGVREEYPDTSSSIIPYLRMAYTNTGGSISSTGYTLGIFLVKAHYTVRGRRSVTLLPTLRVRMMSQKLLEEYEVAIAKVKADRQRALKQTPRGV